MGGLAHYKNSKISMNNWEPVYMNLFEVVITPPPTVDKWDYVLEEVNKIAGMATDQTPPAGVEQSYKGAKRRFSNSLADSTVVDLSIGFFVNIDDNLSLIAYKGLQNWCKLIWNPLSGAMTLKKDYVGGPLTVFLHNRAGEVFRQWIFPTVWPTASLPEMALDYADGAASYQIDITFAADYWEDMSY
jgi:hypothetical protein